MEYKTIEDILEESWDYIVVNMSGGKDSTALAEWAKWHFPNVTKLIAHAEIDIDWPQTLPTVKAQAEFYGWPLTVVRAIKADGKPSGFIRQLLSPRQIKVKHPPTIEDYSFLVGDPLSEFDDDTDDSEITKFTKKWSVDDRFLTPEEALIRETEIFLEKETPENRIGRSVGETHYTGEYAFPDMGNRWCTSMLKTGPIHKYVRTLKGKILNLLGERREESSQRSVLKEIRPDAKLSKNGRMVVTVSPILDLVAEEVWEIVHKSGAPIHPCYSFGIGRASCAICIFSNAREIRVAWDNVPELVKWYIDSEAKISHSFKYKPATKSRDAVRVSVLELLLSTFEGEEVPVELLNRRPSAQLV